MTTQQKTEDETRTDRNKNQGGNDQSSKGQNRGQGTAQTRGEMARGGGQQDRDQRSRAMQWQQLSGYSPLMLRPFALIRRLQEDIDRVLDVAVRNQGAMTAPGAGNVTGVAQGDWSPAVETFQRGNEFVVRVDLPGLSADDVAIEVGEDALTIRGERRYEHEEERDGVVVSECSYGTFVRVVPLPQGAITDNAKATFRDGVLEIVVPAPSQEARRGRRLEIGRGSNERGDRSSKS